MKFPTPLAFLLTANMIYGPIFLVSFSPNLNTSPYISSSVHIEFIFTESRHPSRRIRLFFPITLGPRSYEMSLSSAWAWVTGRGGLVGWGGVGFLLSLCAVYFSIHTSQNSLKGKHFFWPD